MKAFGLWKYHDVSLNAKIRILKQITTQSALPVPYREMLVSMQRYEF